MDSGSRRARMWTRNGTTGAVRCRGAGCRGPGPIRPVGRRRSGPRNPPHRKAPVAAIVHIHSLRGPTQPELRATTPDICTVPPPPPSSTPETKRPELTHPTQQRRVACKPMPKPAPKSRSCTSMGDIGAKPGARSRLFAVWSRGHLWHLPATARAQARARQASAAARP